MTNLNDMGAGELIKGDRPAPRLVVVIATMDDLARALRMRHPPDFFELRLDALNRELDQVEPSLRTLRAPLIITARHSAEGGLNNLTPKQRRVLLLHHLPVATYVDVELRSAAELKPILVASERRRLKRIISFHDFHQTPSVGDLTRLAQLAAALGADIFKVATQTDTKEDLARLLAFFDLARENMRISAMGLGRLGRSARRQLVRRGSALNYAAIGSAQVEGQLSLREMRQILARVHAERQLRGL